MGNKNEDGLIDVREGMKEGRAEKELGKGEYLESDSERGLLRASALHLD
jgi:hypothetical protein